MNKIYLEKRNEIKVKERNHRKRWAIRNTEKYLKIKRGWNYRKTPSERYEVKKKEICSEN